jgi:hypothetical protein
VTLTFAGLPGEADVNGALRRFLEAHPAMESARSEIALRETSDDLTLARGTLHAEGSTPPARRAHDAPRGSPPTPTSGPPLGSVDHDRAPSA